VIVYGCVFVCTCARARACMHFTVDHGVICIITREIVGVVVASPCHL